MKEKRMKRKIDSYTVISIIVWVCIILFVYVLFFSRANGPSKKQIYEDKIMAKYNIDGGYSYDYYQGFDAGVEYANDNIEKLREADEYAHKNWEYGYEDGYSEGYAEAIEDMRNGKAVIE